MQNDKFFNYTTPVIGTAVGVVINTDWTGYHTHPSGGAFFSNNLNMAGSGNDVKWASTHGSLYNKGLYLGVQLSTGHVAISFCATGACSSIRRFGAVGRSLQ